MDILSSTSQCNERVWLVVEDDHSVRMLVCTMMKLWGIQPLAFADGYRIMQWLDDVECGRVSQLPELALMDIKLPGPHGHQVAQRLRQLPATAAMPIVLMTAFTFSPREIEDIERIAQPDRFISKPLPTPNELKALLEDAVAARAQVAVRHTDLRIVGNYAQR